MPKSPLTAQQIVAAVDMARELMTERGFSQNKATRVAGEKYGVSDRTVMRWAVSLGTPLGHLSRDTTKTRAATKANSTYALERRIDLNDRMFEKLSAMLDTIDEPGELRELTLSYEKLTAARRLEAGEATERHEHSDLGEEIKRGREQFKLLRGRSGS